MVDEPKIGGITMSNNNYNPWSDADKGYFNAYLNKCAPEEPKLGWRAEGRKDDEEKIRMELIPPELNLAVGDILTFGAKKYADRNWELGMKWSRVYGALLRHLTSWFNPFEEDVDPETGKSHLWHAGCCIAFLIAYEQRGDGEDDRPKSR